MTYVLSCIPSHAERLKRMITICINEFCPNYIIQCFNCHQTGSRDFYLFIYLFQKLRIYCRNVVKQYIYLTKIMLLSIQATMQIQHQWANSNRLHCIKAFTASFFKWRGCMIICKLPAKQNLLIMCESPPLCTTLLPPHWYCASACTEVDNFFNQPNSGFLSY